MMRISADDFMPGGNRIGDTLEILPIVEKHGLPVHFIGVGEKADDLQPFDADSFARALAGAE